jgi:hypothetical protein
MAEAIEQNPLRFAVTIAFGRTKGKAIVASCKCCSGPVKKTGFYQIRANYPKNNRHRRLFLTDYKNILK